MFTTEPRRLLILEPTAQRYRLRTLHPATLEHDPREEYGPLSGEALCQYLLREDPEVLVLARGPLAFLSGNKMTVGYFSPLTRLPHYSFVGGRGFAELLNLGLDAIVFAGEPAPARHYAVISGRAPHLTVEWKDAAGLPTGQRSAFHWLVERELGGNGDRGSVFTLGEAAQHGYRTANLGVDNIYHAGRGGAGRVFARFAAALVLRGETIMPEQLLGVRAENLRFLRNGEIRDRLERYGERLSRRDGGTVTKLYRTGSGPRPTLPARNARRLGYALSDLGARKILHASRVGQTGCQWCQVNCRHWHWVEADYAPEGRDRFLDDFEPAYALFAMLDLRAEDGSRRAKLRLLEEVDRRVMQPLEELGIDVIDAGVGLAALFEGLERGLVPAEEVPEALRGARLGETAPLLAAVEEALRLLREGSDLPALRALAGGPEALAERYPELRDALFTCGPGTLGNPGHANALWTFLMPFSRFFGHYSGQIYKVRGELRPGMSDAEIDALFERVIERMLQREQFGILCNAFSACAFTFVIFSADNRSIALDEDDLLVRLLRVYGMETTRADLEWFAEAFWAQSIALKAAQGWRPPTAAELPERVFEALAQALDFPPDELRTLMERLIAVWRRHAAALLYKYGYKPLPALTPQGDA
ncbi:MAG: aldehyde ferredoxin oxidoreductase N-terminal domain-containing protein [Anaerolineales bacterium]